MMITYSRSEVSHVERAGEELRQAVRDGTFIKHGDERSAEGVKYDFHLGSELLKAKFRRPVDVKALSETEKRELVIEPGEMVFAFTQEHLALSADMIAFLSPKRKMSHAGVLVIGGFCVDPKYHGPLNRRVVQFLFNPLSSDARKKGNRRDFL